MHIGSLSPFTVYKIKQDKLWGGRKVSRKLENSDFYLLDDTEEKEDDDVTLVNRVEKK